MRRGRKGTTGPGRARVKIAAACVIIPATGRILRLLLQRTQQEGPAESPQPGCHNQWRRTDGGIRRPGGGGGGEPLPERDIVEGFDLLIAADRLFGADLNPTMIKKSGKGTPFLVRRPPSRHRMLALWRELFGNRVSPKVFLDALAPEVLGLAHDDGLLLFGKDRVLYDCQIVRGSEAGGHLTLAL